jgi:dUTPase
MKHKCDREVVWLSKRNHRFNSPGTVDGIIEEKLCDFSKFIQSSFEIQNGERIAQLIMLNTTC